LLINSPSGIAKSTGTGWATSIVDNSSNWNNAYTYRLTGASGTSPLTLSLSANNLTGSLSSQLTAIGKLTPSTGYLYYNGSSFSYATPVTGSKWTADTYGINYQSGNVGIGGVSTSAEKLYVTGNTAVSIKGYNYNGYGVVGDSYNGYGVVAGSTIGTGLYATGGNSGVQGITSTGIGVFGDATGSGTGVQGGSTTGFGGVFGGLGCKATKFYVSSLNTAPASSSATGTTGEIRFTSDYIYVCVATNTWKRTQISTW